MAHSPFPAHALKGLMMDFPLTLHHIFHKNETLFGKKQVFSILDGSKELHRYTYAGTKTFHPIFLIIAKIYRTFRPIIIICSCYW